MVPALAKGAPGALPRPGTAAGPLRLAGALAQDAVTAERVEMKFALRDADVHKLRSILETNLARVVHGGPVSCVRSLYFDDARLSACRENLSGASRRTKMRLRWYDRELPGTRAVLEIKQRANRTVSKQRFPLESEVAIESLRHQTLRSALCRVLPERARELLMLRPEPILITEYRREHFRDPFGPIRVTLDYGLVVYDQTGAGGLRRGFALPIAGLVVVEAKAPPGREADVRHLLHPLRLRLTRSSKYVQGCRTLGLLTAVAGPVDA